MYKKRNPYRRTDKVKTAPAAKSSWNGVANWYSDHLREGGEYQREIIFPAALALLHPKTNGTYLDIACGEGTFARQLAQKVKQGSVIGFDASPKLIEYAKQGAPLHLRFFVADATHFAHQFPPSSIDGATCLMAIQNIELFDSTFHETARVLKPGGTFVIIMNHPAFRQPRQSGWGWDEERKLQYRRVDRYLGSYEMPIIAHPGSAPGIKTLSYHRPLSAYLNALSEAGFMLEQMEEYTSHKTSDSGPRAKAENIAREEIPLFLALRLTKR